ncbi:hypothetical protein [Diplocloster agilis]|uniref:Uncharacterized protein n=1 Tax=Diplocloster agilis TaxID=2850323 RepID=A0A949K3B5_9FIRM|nr:hypothetical protein [Diplocloster agilis]MBU9739316.1 hypothetical protein [Diplocloster agilis]MBU9746596.1 hypothetical protein [Diplocloster agilis]
MIEYEIIPLGEILKKEYEQQKIEDAFKKFSCCRETDLEDFLTHRAIPYEKTNYGKTHLFIDSRALSDGQFNILAYFTIAQNSLDISCLSPKRKRKVLGEYPGRDRLNSVPTYLIGQLGRCDQCPKEDLNGLQILNECYHAISLAARVVGGNLIVLECREHMFDKFYNNQGFKKLYDELNDEGLFTLYKKINFNEYWNN